MNLFDFNHPFFKPLWIRVLIVVICLGWGVFEFVSGSPFWGTLFGGLGVLAAYGFFITFEPRDTPEKNKE